MRLALCFLLLLPSLTLAADSLSDSAIADAISLLEEQQKVAKERFDSERLRLAINGLRQALAANGERVDLVDFIDNMGKYKGRTLTMDLEFVGDDAFPDRTLRDTVGEFPEQVASFETKERDSLLKLAIEFPVGIEVPDAKRGERVVVTFISSGRTGFNKAKSVKRPAPRR